MMLFQVDPFFKNKIPLTFFGTFEVFNLFIYLKQINCVAERTICCSNGTICLLYISGENMFKLKDVGALVSESHER